MSLYTPSGTNPIHTAYTMPDDGTFRRNVASVRQVLEPMAEDIAALAARTGYKLVAHGGFSTQAAATQRIGVSAYSAADNFGLFNLNGIVPGDVIEADIRIGRVTPNPIYGGGTHKLRIGYSTDATTYTNGTWADVVSSGLGYSEIGYPGTAPGAGAEISVPQVFNFELAPAWPVGPSTVRFALQGHGLNINAVILDNSTASGKWRIWRLS